MTLVKRTVRLLFLGVLAAPFGCSDGGQVNIGNTQTLGGQLSDYVATWDGYVQSSTFSDGSDRVRLTIDADGHATLQVGDSPPLPAPTDAHRGYPPGAGNMFMAGQLNPPYPGFAYPLHGTRVQTRRIQLAVDFNDVYADWCAIQTPVSTGPDANTGADTFGCAPPFTMIEHATPNSPSCVITTPDGTTQTADCGWLTLCSLPATTCTCTATACTAALVTDGAPVGQYPFQFDGRLDATGSTLIGSWGGLTVILDRQN